MRSDTRPFLAIRRRGARSVIPVSRARPAPLTRGSQTGRYDHVPGLVRVEDCLVGFLTNLARVAEGRTVRTRVWGLGLGAGAMLAGQQTAAAAAPAVAAKSPAEVRVNQVGYSTGASKVAYVMLPATVPSVSFTVTGAHGAVLHGHSSDLISGWNSHYHAVYQLNFSRLRTPGSYRVAISAGGQSATSPAFRVGSGAAL